MSRPPAAVVTTKGFYIDLDSLYDTRLATLELIDPELALHALENNYLKREDNNFPLVDKNLFDELYSGRDLEVLERALPTKALEIIQSFIRAAERENMESPRIGPIEIYINVWPYKVAKSVAQQMTKTLFETMARSADIHLINMSPEQVTPAFFQKNISAALMYDYGPWLDAHSKNDNFRKNQIPDVSLFVPTLYFVGKPSEAQLREFERNGPGVFKLIEIGASQLVGLEFVDNEYFNAVIPADFIEQRKKSKTA